MPILLAKLKRSVETIKREAGDQGEVVEALQTLPGLSLRDAQTAGISVREAESFLFAVA